MEITIILVIISSLLVLGDSYKFKKVMDNGEHPIAWFLGCLLLWIIIFPYYLYKRNRYYVSRFREFENKKSQSNNINHYDNKHCKYCTDCGLKNEKDNKYCTQCGNSFEINI